MKKLFKVFLLFCLFLVVAFFVLFERGKQPTDAAFTLRPQFLPSPQIIKPLTPEEIRLEVSDYRKQQDLPGLTVSQSLCNFANLRLQQLGNSLDNHAGFTRLIKTNYPTGYDGIAENLAENFNNNQTLLNAWLASPPHRRNIEDSRFTDACVRVNNRIIVMIFGQPLPPAQPVQHGDSALLEGVFENHGSAPQLRY